MTAGLHRALAWASGKQSEVPLGDFLDPSQIGFFTSLVAFEAATIPAAVETVYVTSYYGDGLEVGDNFSLTRITAGQAAALLYPYLGCYQSADGAWWINSMLDVDHRQFGGRQSDRTTISTTALQSAINFCRCDFYSDRTTQSGNRRVVIRGTMFASNYAAKAGAVMVDQSILGQPGVEVRLEAGAEICALGSTASYTASFAPYTSTSSLMTVTTTPTRMAGTANAGTPVVQIGATLSASGLAAGVKVNRQISTTGSALPGGAGTYEVSQAFTLASTTVTSPFWDSPYDGVFEVPAGASWQGNRFTLSGYGVINANNIAPLCVEAQNGENISFADRLTLQFGLIGGAWIGSYYGSLTFTANPTAGNHVVITTLKGATTTTTTIGFVASGATGAQVNIGANATATAANLTNYLVANANTIGLDPVKTTSSAGVVTLYGARPQMVGATLCVGPQVFTKLGLASNDANVTALADPYTPFQAIIENIQIVAPFATSYANRRSGGASSYTGIGLWMRGATDSVITGLVMITGYFCSYRDDGADNTVLGQIHANTAGNSGNGQQWGPNAYTFYMNGTSRVPGYLFSDTPTTMGDASLTYAYGLTLGAAAAGTIIDNYAAFLNYDDFTTLNYTSNCAVVINNLSSDLTNGLGDVGISSAAPYTILANSSTLNGSWIARKTLSTQYGSCNSSDLAARRPPTGQTIYDGVSRPSMVDNADFNLWTRGAGPFSCPSANNRYFGPDRWFLLADGAASGTRTLSQHVLTAAERNYGYGPRTAQLAISYQRTGGSPDAGSYCRIGQVLPIKALYALADQQISAAARLWSTAGTAPNVRFGMTFNYGTGGSPSASQTIFTGYTGAVSSGPYSATQLPFPTSPSLNGITLGTNNDAYVFVFVDVPINIVYTFEMTEFVLQYGDESILFTPTITANEIMQAARYCQTLSIQTLANVTTWYGFPVKMANAPSVQASSGTATVSGITVNGCFVADTAAETLTLTAIATSEP